MRKNRRWVALGVVAVVALVGALTLFGSGGSDAEARASLEAEFADAYPASASAGGDLVEVELVAAPTAVEVVEGSMTEVWAYNGIVPGEPIRISLGDTLRVTLQNELPVATTLHWHGVRVPNDVYGVPGGTQDAVAPGDSFTYEFTPPDAGTFWYHSAPNNTEQLERGLYGSLVVEDPAPQEYSQDVVWVIDDWSLTSFGQIDPGFNLPTDVEHNGRWGDLITVNGSTAAELRARPGERVRLRLINASVAHAYALRFSDPPADLIAVDGLYVREPKSADAQVVPPGTRIDVDMVMPDRPGSYEITNDFAGASDVIGTLVVEGDSVETPDFALPSNPGLPVWADAQDVGVDIEYIVNLRVGSRGAEWALNDDVFPNVDPKQIEPGRFTKIRFNNASERLHPMYMHGQFFKVLAVNGEPVDEGHFRSSVLLFANDVVDIGLVSLNEGSWILQCTIMEHAAAGMMTVIDVKAPS